MAKLTLSNLQTLTNDLSATSTINSNNDATEAAFDNTLSRDGTAPNEMEADFDMNSNRILNLPQPASDMEPVRLVDLKDQVFPDFDIIIASEAAALEGTSNDVLMTPLRTTQVINDRLANLTVDLSKPPYNLDLDNPTLDQSDIIQTAFADYAGSGAVLMIPAIGTPTIGVGTTLSVPRGVTFQGGSGYGGNAQSDANFTGAVLSWVGGNNGTVVEIKGDNHTRFCGFKIDGNGKTGVIGLHLWSVNDPPQSYNIVEHFVIKRCFKSLVLSDPGDTSYAPDGPDPNNVGRAQNDSLDIKDFVIFGDGTSGSTGIHINGTNVAQSSVICRGNIQSCAYGVRVIQTNGNLRLQQLNGGNAVFQKTFIRYEASLAVHPVLDQCETEGLWTYAVHDSSTPFDGMGGYKYAPYTQLWLNNQFNSPILIDGGSRIVSITNSGGNPLSVDQQWIVGGTAYVWSVCDVSIAPETIASPWTASGSGQVSVIGDRALIQGVYTGQLSAGVLPDPLIFLRGGISSAMDDGLGGNTSGRYYFGATGDYYITNVGSHTWMKGMGLAVGDVIPSGFLQSGEIASVTGNLTGIFMYGSDRNVYSIRDGNDVKFVLGTGGRLFANAVPVAMSDKVREKLSATRNYYVRADGNDGNDGLANSSGRAFLTLQHAMDVIANLDLGTSNVVVTVGNGTYAGFTLKSYVGSGTVTFNGDQTTQSNVTISDSSRCVLALSGLQGTFTLSGFRFQSSATQDVFISSGSVTLTNNEYAGTANYRVYCLGPGVITFSGANNKISGGGIGMFLVESFGTMFLAGSTWSVTTNVTYSGAFMSSRTLAISTSNSGSTVFNLGSNTVTGPRYSATANAIINGTSANASFFPGTTAGSTATGGIYA